MIQLLIGNGELARQTSTINKTYNIYEINMNTIFPNFQLGGKIIKDDDNYMVIDNTFLENVTVSSTNLYPGKSTGGHSHDTHAEMYIFLYGNGEMEIGDKRSLVKEGDIVQVPAGDFHRVHAGKDGCYFLAIFGCERNH